MTLSVFFVLAARRQRASMLVVISSSRSSTGCEFRNDCSMLASVEIGRLALLYRVKRFLMHLCFVSVCTRPAEANRERQQLDHGSGWLRCAQQLLRVLETLAFRLPTALAQYLCLDV